jgi:hypothetical protein
MEDCNELPEFNPFSDKSGRFFLSFAQIFMVLRIIFCWGGAVAPPPCLVRLCIESNTDVNVSWSQWKEKYLAAIRDFVPMRKIKGKNSPPWITGDILHMIKKKESVRRKLRTSSSVYLIAKFKQLRFTVKRMISDSRAKYFENFEQDIVTNAKRFWSVFKIRKKATSVPEQMSVPSDTKDTDTNVKVDRKLISCNPVEIAEHFNRYFTSIFSCDSVESPTQLPPINCQSFQRFPSRLSKWHPHFVHLMSAKHQDLMELMQDF